MCGFVFWGGGLLLVSNMCLGVGIWEGWGRVEPEPH